MFATPRSPATPRLCFKKMRPEKGGKGGWAKKRTEGTSYASTPRANLKRLGLRWRTILPNRRPILNQFFSISPKVRFQPYQVTPSTVQF
jgi:hypothetical protein